MPDVAYSANQSAQFSNQTFGKRKINELNREIQNMKQNVSRTRIYSKLSPDSLELRVYADTLYYTKEDLISQLGYIILLCDESTKYHVLNFSY